MHVHSPLVQHISGHCALFGETNFEAGISQNMHHGAQMQINWGLNPTMWYNELCLKKKKDSDVVFKFCKVTAFLNRKI